MKIEDVLKINTPSVYNDEALSTASEKYDFLSTTEIIAILFKMGWKLYTAEQQNSKKAPDTTKHMLRFRNDKYGSFGNNGNIPEIIIVNSHDRTTSLQIYLGICRVISSSLCIVKTKEFRQRHNGSKYGESFNNIIEMITDISKNEIPIALAKISSFENYYLTQEEKIEMAEKCISIKYPEYIINDSINLELLNKTINVQDIIQPTRTDDYDNSLWTTFNICQEHLLKGGYKHIGTTNISKTAATVKNIRKIILINQALWQIMETYEK